MSEREVRDCLKWARTLDLGFVRDKKRTRHWDRTKWVLASKDALDKPPDLVGVLRYTNELRDSALASGKLGSFAVVDGLLYVIEYITDEIGLRLTEDGGWVWLGEDDPKRHSEPPK